MKRSRTIPVRGPKRKPSARQSAPQVRSDSGLDRVFALSCPELSWGDMVYFGQSGRSGAPVLMSLDRAVAEVARAKAARVELEEALRSRSVSFFALAHEVSHQNVRFSGAIVDCSLSEFPWETWSLPAGSIGDLFVPACRRGLLPLLRSAAIAERAARAALRWLLRHLTAVDTEAPNAESGAQALANLSSTLAREWKEIKHPPFISPATSCQSPAHAHEYIRPLGLRIPVHAAGQRCPGPIRRPPVPTPRTRGARLARSTANRPLGRGGHLRTDRRGDRLP